MMDSITGLNRGYAFVTYTTKDGAAEAVKHLNSLEIIEGKALKVNMSVPNTRLFIGNIPKSKSREDIGNTFGYIAPGLVEVII